MEFRLEDEVPMSAQELWLILHTPEFDAFVAKEYGLKAYIELDRNTLDNVMRRRVRVIKKVDLNYAVKRLAQKVLGGDELVYEEIQEKYFDRFEMSWRIVPPVLKDKFEAYGILLLKPIDENRCIRIREGIVQIHMFGVTQMLEWIAGLQTKRTKDKFPHVVSNWKLKKQMSKS